MATKPALTHKICQIQTFDFGWAEPRLPPKGQSCQVLLLDSQANDELFSLKLRRHGLVPGSYRVYRRLSSVYTLSLLASANRLKVCNWALLLLQIQHFNFGWYFFRTQFCFFFIFKCGSQVTSLCEWVVWVALALWLITPLKADAPR